MLLRSQQSKSKPCPESVSFRHLEDSLPQRAGLTRGVLPWSGKRKQDVTDQTTEAHGAQARRLLSRCWEQRRCRRLDPLLRCCTCTAPWTRRSRTCSRIRIPISEASPGGDERRCVRGERIEQKAGRQVGRPPGKQEAVVRRPTEGKRLDDVDVFHEKKRLERARAPT